MDHFATVEKNRELALIYIRNNNNTADGGLNANFYGEVTKQSMQTMAEVLHTRFSLNDTSKILDIGSGLGIPSFHLARWAPISLGIESSVERVYVRLLLELCPLNSYTLRF